MVTPVTPHCTNWINLWAVWYHSRQICIGMSVQKKNQLMFDEAPAQISEGYLFFVSSFHAVGAIKYCKISCEREVLSLIGD